MIEHSDMYVYERVYVLALTCISFSHAHMYVHA